MTNRRADPKASRARTGRWPRSARRLIRRPVALVAAVVAVFVVALLLWTAGLSGSGAVVVAPATGAALGSTVAEGPQPATGSANPTSAATGSTGGTAPTGALSGLPPDTIHTFAPGPHTVVATATSTTGRIGTVAYVFTGHGPGKTVYDVRAPLRVSARVPGQHNFVAMGLQVGPDGGSATCSVSVDGVVIVRYTATGANRVVECIV